jgi:hypothetical protein
VRWWYEGLLGKREGLEHSPFDSWLPWLPCILCFLLRSPTAAQGECVALSPWPKATLRVHPAALCHVGPSPVGGVGGGVGVA